VTVVCVCVCVCVRACVSVKAPSEEILLIDATNRHSIADVQLPIDG